MTTEKIPNRKQQYQLYALIDNKIELERIQNALNYRCTELKEFLEILDVMQDNETANLIDEQDLVTQLVSAVDKLITKKVEEIDIEYLELVQIS